MRIQDITLTNYRLYKGINTISFRQDKQDKNVYLISGENGFGKTTFLHSLLWCLYGKLMADIDETLRKDIANNGGYNQFLIHNLNNSCKQFVDSVGESTLSRIKKSDYTSNDLDIQSEAVYSVAINFSDISIPSIPCQSLKVIRSYDIIKGLESVEVLIDNHINELSSSIGNDVFINDFILNKDIARFFFFDSERIVALAETNTTEDRRRLNSAYNEVLGVKKYEDLKHNLENLRLKFRKRSSDIESRNKLSLLLDKQQTVANDVKVLDSNLEKYQAQLQTLKQRNDELQEQLLREGQGMSMEDYKRQKALIEAVRSKDEVVKSRLKEFVELAPFAIVGDLLKKTRNEITKDYNLSKAAQNIQIQNQLLRQIESELIIEATKASGEQKAAVNKVIKDVLAKYYEEEQTKEPLLNVSKSDYQEFEAIFANLTSTYKVEFEHLADDNKKNKQILSKAQVKISNMQANESDDVIKKLRTEKDQIEKAIEELEERIRQVYTDQGSLSQEAATLKKNISELSKRVSVDGSDSKKDELSGALIEDLDTFLKGLKEEKKNSLERRLKGVMNCLMHKSDFIGSVKVNVLDDGLDIDLFTPAGKLIRKDSLSKGEQQLYATSLLKALVDESGIEFPVFIDSPLQKFDKSHSNKIITEFYPSISKQVVLFPLLHKELTESELDLMKPLVNTSYLIKNEIDHSYFKEVATDKLMYE